MKRNPKNQTKQVESLCTAGLTQAIPVTLSVFARASATKPGEAPPMVWPAFVEALREGVQHTVHAPTDDSEAAWQRAKRALPGLVCAAFSGPRSNDTVGDHTAIVIDVDHPSPDVLERLQRYQAVAYETPSSRRKSSDDLRLRVCVALTEPVPPHAVKAARSALAVELGLDPLASGVSQADAASQLMFIGRVDGTPERQLWIFDGAVWTPPPPGEAPPAREQVDGDASAPQWGADRIPDLSALAKAIGTLDEHGMRRGGRDTSRAIGGLLARAGWHPDAIYQAVGEQIPSDDPWGEERAEAARDAAEAVYRGQANTIGYQYLAERFGEAVMAELESATADPWIKMMAAKWPELKAAKRPANDTAESAPAAPQPAGLWQWVDASDLAKPLPPVEYRCEALGFVLDRDHRPDMIVGPAGYGKTGLAQAYALAVASGEPLFGTETVKAGVVYHIDNEQGLGATQYRYQLLAGGAGVDLRSIAGKLRVFADGVRLTRGDQINQQAVDALRRNTEGADIVIIDSLITLGLGIDENSVAFGEVLMLLRDITRKGGPKHLILHHSGKGEGSADGRGSSAIDGERGSTWVGSKTFTWRHRKKSLSDTADFRTPFTTEWKQPPLDWRSGKTLPTAQIVLADGKGPASGEPTDDEQRRITNIVAKHPDGISQRQVEMALQDDIGRNRVRDIVAVMVANGGLYQSGKLSTARLHVASLPTERK